MRTLAVMDADPLPRPPAVAWTRSLRTRATLLLRLGRSPGDETAWAEFEDTYAGLIRAIARQLGLDAAAADDVAQDVWLALYRRLPFFRYDPRKGSFRGYLHTTVRRAAWRRWRREARARGAERGAAATRDAWEEDFEAAWEEAWRKRRLAEAMESIQPEFSPRDRAVFAAYAVAGRPTADVAAEFDLSVNQVHQVRSRVLRRLRAVVAARVDEEDAR